MRHTTLVWPKAGHGLGVTLRRTNDEYRKLFSKNLEFAIHSNLDICRFLFYSRVLAQSTEVAQQISCLIGRADRSFLLLAKVLLVKSVFEQPRRSAFADFDFWARNSFL